MNPQAPRRLRLTPAAKHIGVSAVTLRRWADAGKIPVYRTPGGQRLFDVTDLDKALSAA